MRLALALLATIIPSIVLAQDELKLELNTAESAQGRCRVSFMVENKADRPVESFKLHLVMLGTENTMQRRMVVDIAPIRRSKTIIRTYEFERDCTQIGAILVNDVQACAPGDPSTC